MFEVVFDEKHFKHNPCWVGIEDCLFFPRLFDIVERKNVKVINKVLSEMDGPMCLNFLMFELRALIWV